MKKIITIVALICLWLLTTKPVNARELQRAKATAYCLTGTTATGTQTKAYRTVASKPEYFGSTIYIWEDDGDGIVKPENYIGCYVVEDTGGENVKKGYVIDIYIPSYNECRAFGVKDVIYQIVEAEG